MLEAVARPADRCASDRIVLHVHEHQAKGQFLELARGLLESGPAETRGAGAGRGPRRPGPGRPSSGPSSSARSTGSASATCAPPSCPPCTPTRAGC
ncbi:MAG: hypothetical protein MZV65_15450 [Chromatiales bacterium]|nr:hypothetical protein [Chromatiales bacterium]